MQKFYYSFTLLFLFIGWSKLTAQDQPNILLIISDDLGVDVSNGYHDGNLMPTTPTLDSLRSVGITFENVWAAPVCSPTRAAIMTGKHGVKTGVLSVPGSLDLIHTSIFKAVENQTNNEYADALVGKWHLGQGAGLNHPSEHGVDFFSGPFQGAVSDYFNWTKTEQGVSSNETEYATTHFTNTSLDWINNQTKPWLLWLAHVAPHTPIHVPPAGMYSIPTTGTNFRKYIAMIEAMDFEIGRLLNNMSTEDRENTIIIYVGDNGTPNSLLQDYPNMHGKGSLYQGGIRVPMIVAGKGVTRQGEREAALINVVDIHATILEIVGAELEGGIYNSLSFHHLLTGDTGATRDYNYSEFLSTNNGGFAIRNQQYKLIENSDNTQEFYDLLADSLEVNDLMLGTLTAEQQMIKDDFLVEAAQINIDWSCRDHIRNGDEEGIDCGGTYCAECTTSTGDLMNQKNKFKVFPNPAFDQLNLNSDRLDLESIQVYNLVGELVIEKNNINSTNMTMDLNQLNSQIYFIKITTAEGIDTVRFIKL